MESPFLWLSCRATAGTQPDADNTARIEQRTVENRLDQIVRRYARGVGFWVSALATPTDLSARLKQRGFRCRKCFPGMYCDLSDGPASAVEPKGLSFRVSVAGVYDVAVVPSARDHGIGTAMMQHA
jgi:ribosomal protein S18 acetylase RimI-like enzyme